MIRKSFNSYAANHDYYRIYPIVLVVQIIDIGNQMCV